MQIRFMLRIQLLCIAVAVAAALKGTSLGTPHKDDVKGTAPIEHTISISSGGSLLRKEVREHGRAGAAQPNSPPLEDTGPDEDEEPDPGDEPETDAENEVSAQEHEVQLEHDLHENHYETASGGDDDDAASEDDPEEEIETETDPEVNVPTFGYNNVTSAVKAHQDCVEEYLVSGDWCEETCSDPDNKMAEASGLSSACENACSDCSTDCPCMPVKQHDLNMAVFAKEESTFPKAGVFKMKPGCNPHYVIKNTLCEMFCATTDPHLIHYADTRTGVNKGECFGNGWPKFIGHGTMMAFGKESDSVDTDSTETPNPGSSEDSTDTSH